MKKKLKVYVITLSRVFPVSHPKAGQPTYFKEKIYNAGVLLMQALEYMMPANSTDPNCKYHTIRANYELWRKRFEQIERGEACLSIRQWTGKPYASKQIEIARLTKDDGIGLQKLTIYKQMNPVYAAMDTYIYVDGRLQNSMFEVQLSNKDGLTSRQDAIRRAAISNCCAGAEKLISSVSVLKDTRRTTRIANFGKRTGIVSTRLHVTAMNCYCSQNN